MTFFRLIRWPNLLVIFIIFYVYAFFLVYPTVIHAGAIPNLGSKDFYVLVFIALCIAAGGYIYNDIVDVETDRENDKRSILGHRITKGLGLTFYAFVTLAPFPMALYLAIEINHLEYLWLYFLAVGLLWLYNQYLKRWPIIGNLVVAILCASIFPLQWLAEREGLEIVQTELPDAFQSLKQITIGYFIFVIINSLSREHIKDMEDSDGDAVAGYKTFPIIFDLKASKIFAILLAIINLAYVVLWIHDTVAITAVRSWAYIFLVIPQLAILLQLLKLNEFSSLKQISTAYKVYFMFGLFFLIIASSQYRQIYLL